MSPAVNSGDTSGIADSFQTRASIGNAVAWYLRRYVPMQTENPNVSSMQMTTQAERDRKCDVRAVSSVSTRPSTRASDSESCSRAPSNSSAWDCSFADGQPCSPASGPCTPAWRTYSPAGTPCSSVAQPCTPASDGLLVTAGLPPMDERGASRRPHNEVPARPQKRFLQDAVLAIGAELDEFSSSAASSLLSGKNDNCLALWAASPARRDRLRRSFIAFDIGERRKLEEKVRARRRKVAAIRAYIEDLEKQIDTTRGTSRRRALRLSGVGGLPELSPKKCMTAKDAAQQVMRTRNLAVVLRSRCRAISDVTPNARLGTLEVLQQVQFRKEAENERLRNECAQKLGEMHAKFVRQEENCEARDEVLRATCAEMMNLRESALNTEARIAKLAETLRQVYRTFPEVAQQHDDSSSVGRAQLVENGVEQFKRTYEEERFKLLVPDAWHREMVARDTILRESQSSCQLMAESFQGAFDSVINSLAGTGRAHAALDALGPAWEVLGLVTGRQEDANGAQEPVHEARLATLALEGLFRAAQRAVLTEPIVRHGDADVVRAHRCPRRAQSVSC